MPCQIKSLLNRLTTRLRKRKIKVKEEEEEDQDQDDKTLTSKISAEPIPTPPIPLPVVTSLDSPPQLPALNTTPLSTVTGMEEKTPYGETKQNSFPRIYLFGDSLTDRAFFESNNGFGWKLQEYYEGRVEVVNRGGSGFTSRCLRDDFQEKIIKVAKGRGTPEPLLITIFLGANDACLPPVNAYVPLPEYEQHIRYYVNTILENPATKGTRVVLITPPPINVRAPAQSEVETPSVAMALESAARNGMGHRTWLSKRTYAEKVVKIGREFEAKTNLVTVLDFWKAITKVGCLDEGDEPAMAAKKFRELDIEDRLPGCGLPGAKKFGAGFFTDGLHLDSVSYEALSRDLLGLITTKWPEMTRNALPVQVPTPTLLSLDASNPLVSQE